MKNIKTLSIYLFLGLVLNSCTKDELPEPEKKKEPQEAPKTVDFGKDSTNNSNGEG